MALVVVGLIGALGEGAYVSSQRQETTLAAERMQAQEEADRIEAIRIAERARVQQGIPGTWHYWNSAEGIDATVQISRYGDAFDGEYRSGQRVEPLSGRLMADNRLHLVNVRQWGKLVRPGTWYAGDFSQEAWLQLDADAGVLNVRCSSNSSSFRMIRASGGGPVEDPAPVGHLDIASDLPLYAGEPPAPNPNRSGIQKIVPPDGAASSVETPLTPGVDNWSQDSLRKQDGLPNDATTNPGQASQPLPSVSASMAPVDPPVETRALVRNSADQRDFDKPPQASGPPGQGPPLVGNGQPIMRQYDEFGQELWPPAAVAGSPIYLIAFKDRVIRPAESYWLNGQTLHYVTLEHAEKTVPLDTVDRDLSAQLNRERRVQFQLPQ